MASLNTYSNTVSPAQAAIAAAKRKASGFVGDVKNNIGSLTGGVIGPVTGIAGAAYDAYRSRQQPQVQQPAQTQQVQQKNSGGTQSQTGSSTGFIKAPTSNPIITPQPTPTPAVANVTTPKIDPGSAARALYQAGQATPMEQKAIERVSQAQGINNIGALAPYAESQFYGGPGQLVTPDLATPDLAGRDAGTQGLYNKLGNIFGSQATQELAAANTIANRGTTAAQGVLNASLPQQISPGQTAYNPLTGENISGIGGNAFSGGQQLGQVTAGQQYQSNLGAHKAAQAIQGQINNYLTANPGVNSSSFTKLNDVQNLLNGKLSDPRYQQLSNYLSEYISTLAPILGVGGDTTNLKTEIAQSMVNASASGQSISTVLDSIDKLAAAKLEAQRQAGMGNAGASTTTATNTGDESLYSF